MNTDVVHPADWGRRSRFVRIARITASAVDLHGVGHPETAVVSGVGRDTDSALLSCRGEAVERGAALRWDARSLLWASAAQLGESGRLFHDEQELTRQPEYLPGFRPIAPDVQRPWLPARPLSGYDPTVSQVLLPASAILLGLRRVPEIPRQHLSNSNGLAAHYDKDSALTAALLELIERDAVLCWWWGLIKGARLAGPLGQQLAVLARLEHGATLHPVLLRTDVACPTVACAIVSAGGHLVFGAAAGTCVHVAAGRAYNEASGGLEVLMWSARDQRPTPRGFLASRFEHHLSAAETRARFLEVEDEEPFPERCDCANAPGRPPALTLVRDSLHDRIRALAVDLRSDDWHVIRTVSPDLLPLNTAPVEQPDCSERVKCLAQDGKAIAAVPAADTTHPHPIS